MRVAIIGAGGHSKVIADAILAADCDQIFGFFDDNPSLCRNTLLGFYGHWPRKTAGNITRLTHSFSELETTRHEKSVR